MDKNWTKELKDKMQDYQEIAPEGLWSDISKEMNLTSGQKKPVLPVLLKYGGAVAAAAVIILGVWFYWTRSNVTIVDNREYISDSDITVKDITDTYFTEKDIIDKDSNKNKDIRIDADGDKDIHIDSDKDKNKDADKDANQKAEIKVNKESIIKTIPSDGKIYAEIATTDNIRQSTVISQERRPVKDTSQSNDINIPSTPNKSGNGRENGNSGNPHDNLIAADIFGYIEKQETTRKRKFDIGATVSGAIGNMTSQAGYATTIEAANITAFGSSPENDIRMFNRNKEVSSTTKYIQPVKAGIHFKGYISQKWSIGTGLEWTWLHSSLKEGSENYYTSSASDMHYIGIPLTINFDIWQGRNLNVYAFAGGTMEKCLSGKTSVHYVFNNSASKTEIEKFMEKQLQWSVSAGVGLEYNFADFAGIFASPTISWHFDNGSGIDNIYKSRPLNFSLSLGVRFYL